MKRVFAATCLAAAFAVGLAAQQPPQTPSQTSDKDKTVTLTGCVRAGEQPGSFVLANIKADEKAPPGATGTSGTTPAPDTKDFENATVRLANAPASVNLSEHVGHQVQVTGTVAPAAATGTSGAEPSKSSKPEKSLNVRTVTMVSSSCPM